MQCSGVEVGRHLFYIWLSVKVWNCASRRNVRVVWFWIRLILLVREIIGDLLWKVLTPSVSITKVAIAKDDQKALVLTLNEPLTGPQPVLCYAANQASSNEGFKENVGALRDDFEPAMHHDLSAEDLSLLRRWALPARLPIK